MNQREKDGTFTQAKTTQSQFILALDTDFQVKLTALWLINTY